MDTPNATDTLFAACIIYTIKQQEKDLECQLQGKLILSIFGECLLEATCHIDFVRLLTQLYDQCDKNSVDQLVKHAQEIVSDVENVYQVHQLIESYHTYVVHMIDTTPSNECLLSSTSLLGGFLHDMYTKLSHTEQSGISYVYQDWKQCRSTFQRMFAACLNNQDEMNGNTDSLHTTLSHIQEASISLFNANKISAAGSANIEHFTTLPHQWTKRTISTLALSFLRYPSTESSLEQMNQLLSHAPTDLPAIHLLRLHKSMLQNDSMNAMEAIMGYYDFSLDAVALASSGAMQRLLGGSFDPFTRSKICNDRHYALMHIAMIQLWFGYTQAAEETLAAAIVGAQLRGDQVAATIAIAFLAQAEHTKNDEQFAKSLVDQLLPLLQYESLTQEANELTQCIKNVSFTPLQHNRFSSTCQSPLLTRCRYRAVELGLMKLHSIIAQTRSTHTISVSQANDSTNINETNSFSFHGGHSEMSPSVGSQRNAQIYRDPLTFDHAAANTCFAADSGLVQSSTSNQYTLQSDSEHTLAYPWAGLLQTHSNAFSNRGRTRIGLPSIPHTTKLIESVLLATVGPSYTSKDSENYHEQLWESCDILCRQAEKYTTLHGTTFEEGMDVIAMSSTVLSSMAQYNTRNNTPVKQTDSATSNVIYYVAQIAKKLNENGREALVENFITKISSLITLSSAQQYGCQESLAELLVIHLDTMTRIPSNFIHDDLPKRVWSCSHTILKLLSQSYCGTQTVLQMLISLQKALLHISETQDVQQLIRLINHHILGFGNSKIHAFAYLIQAQFVSIFHSEYYAKNEKRILNESIQAYHVLC